MHNKTYNINVACFCNENFTKSLEEIKSFFGFNLVSKNINNKDLIDGKFINIENALRINNSEYKAIRRQVANFKSLGMLDKKKVVTKLLLATRAKLRNSDLIPH